MPSNQPHRRKSEKSAIPLTILASLTLLLSSTVSAIAPFPVGGFAICQTASALHIQGGVTYEPTATYLQTTNQHFRLDLSQSFGGSSAPVWVNLTSDFSPFQRFHSGACAPGQKSFLTVGNADTANAGGPGFMMAYDMGKGTWDPVEKAISQDTSPDGGNGNGNGKGNNKGNNKRVSAAGRTMAGFALAVNPTTGSPLVAGSDSALGVVIGGGWIPQRSSSTPSVPATDMIGLVTAADLISIGKDGSLDGSSFSWTVAPNGGNGGNNVNSNLGPVVGARVVVLPGGTRAVVLGGVAKGGGGGGGAGMSFGNLPIVDMATGGVVSQKIQSASPNGTPTPPTDGKMAYMFGGALVANDRVTNDIFALDLQTWTWSQPVMQPSTTTPPAVRDHQCIMVGDQLLSLLGFNSNQAPASATPLALNTNGTDSPIPLSPPIYVLSTSQWTWSTQFSALPGTPRPPAPPVVSTDGSKGKVNGVAIGFGLVFGLAFAGVIGWQVYSHKRSKQEKTETLMLIEMEQKKKEDEKLAKERLKKDEESSLPPPPPPTQPYPAHLNGGVGGYEQNYYSQGGGGGGYYAGGQDPFQNPSYHHHQQQQQRQQQQLQQNQFAHNQYYARAGHELNPFDHPASDNMYRPPPQVSQHQQQFVPEEMGHFSPTYSNQGAAYHAGHGGHGTPQNDSVKVLVAGGGGARDGQGQGQGGLNVRSAGDKMSFVDSSSAYR
ncbi:hypothetical protein BGX23_004796 [Mortierella sp. AD031]|nr:hypothetical protein BGX23_004796 [Mortierella sp. AD031]